MHTFTIWSAHLGYNSIDSLEERKSGQLLYGYYVAHCPLSKVYLFNIHHVLETGFVSVSWTCLRYV
jgi:hypothetical protein